MLSPVLTKAGCIKNNMTIVLTTMFLLRSLKYFFDMKNAMVHIAQYKNMKNNGSRAIRNILNMTEFGANAFISLSSINQSNETNDSEDDPIISPIVNMSFIDSGYLASIAKVTDITCK